MGVELNVPRYLGNQIVVGRSCNWEDGRLSMVRCKVCNIVQHCEKLPNLMVCKNMLVVEKPNMHMLGCMQGTS
jgi:hypothetical protein